MTGINPAGTTIQQMIQALDGIITSTPSPSNYMYITSQNNVVGGVWRCDFSSNDITNCVRQPTLTSFYAFSTQGAIFGSNYYLPALTPSAIQKCSMNADGTLTSCASSGASGYSGPESIAFNTAGTWAYLADTQSASVREATLTV